MNSFEALEICKATPNKKYQMDSYQNIKKRIKKINNS
jgi:hypothetical protein